MRVTIAQVSPFAWEADSEVGHYVQAVSRELSARGHRVLIIAPSHSQALVRESRRALKQAPESILDRADVDPVLLGVGEVLPFSGARRRAASVPVDVARTIEDALTVLPLDVVHLHEPFAPSASSAALRHSRALNVGSFHLPTERLLSTQLARPISRLLLSRLDARIVSYGATRDLLARYFPGTYRVVLPGADTAGHSAASDSGSIEIVFCRTEERGALRTFFRALRALPPELSWKATVWSPRSLSAPAAVLGKLRDRVRMLSADDCSEQEAIAGADVVVLASSGVRPAPWTLLRALAGAAVPVTSRLPVYDELLEDARYGFQFEPADIQVLASHLAALASDSALLAQSRERVRLLAPQLQWSRVVDELEDVYSGLVARRRDGGDRRISARLSSRRLIDVDLHMHTDHSYDCATPVEVLLAEAKARGLGAIAVTDHNEISGALEARAKAHGVKVIVAEEIKTAGQGEVIGLFIEEKIPRGLSLQETIEEIRRQGGLVYVPHPFDRLHSVPDYEHLLEVLDDVDAIEIFNPRVAISEFNDEAARFAAKYRIPAGAGSDAHVPQGLGSVRIRMRDFDGPEEFIESLRDADIVRNPASLFYVQALKFLQTKALPAPARRAARDRRVRRATGRDRRIAVRRARRNS